MRNPCCAFRNNPVTLLGDVQGGNTKDFGKLVFDQRHIDHAAGRKTQCKRLWIYISIVGSQQAINFIDALIDQASANFFQILPAQPDINFSLFICALKIIGKKYIGFFARGQRDFCLLALGD
ncbi:hypothetical protein D3C87_1416680 [compost metagenome]